MKKIKYLLLGIVSLLGIGSSFGVNPFWYNTIIRESNQTALNGLSSFSYYNMVHSYDNGNNWQYYYNPGFCLYDSYSSFTFNCQGLLNAQNYLNSNLENFQHLWNGNILHNISTSKIFYHNSSFNFDSSGNIKYSINDCLSGSTECITDSYLFFSNSGDFGNLVLSENVSFIHLIGSNYNKNPGILGENKMNHYYFITSKRISSDYGSFYDIPNDYVRKKFYNGLNHTISSISYNSGGFLLFTSTNPLQWSYNESDNIYRLISTSYSGYLVLGVNNYLNGISQNGTIVLSISGGNIFYNYYNSDSPYLNVLSNLIPQDKGYFSNSSLFNSFINDSGSYFEVSGTPNNGNLLIRSYLNGLDVGGFYSDYNFELVSDSNIPVIIPPIGGGGGGGGNGSQPFSSLYYSCLGPTYNTPDGRPPAYCFDSSGNFNAERLKNCFSDIIITGGEIQGGLFCNIDGFVQSVEFVGDGSGVSIVPCTSDSCYSSLVVGQSYINLDPVNNITTGLVLDMITNLTGWVGRCPFPYVDFGFGSTFKVFSYLKSLGYNIDPFIPINCAVAGFHAGRYTILEDLNFTIFDTPILNGDTKNFKILFRFFDVLIIFAIFGIFRFFRRHI